MITQKILFIILLFSQILLFSSYYYIIPKYNPTEFWGNISKNKWKYYLRVAFIAYILNLLLYLYFSFKKNIDETTIFYVLLTLLFYYGLQMYFLPIVLTKNKSYIRLLLGICVFPIFYLAFLAYNQSKKIKNFNEKIFLYIAGILPFLHVLINDFLKYGFEF